MNRFFTFINGVITWVAAIATSAGVADANKIVMTDSTGKLDNSLMPNGVGAEVRTVVASEALAAGDMVNVFNNAGTLNARKADATNAARFAVGYVLAAVANGATATVYYGNVNSQLSGLTPGATLFVSPTTAGAVTATAPTTAGQFVQQVGVALSATEALIEVQQRISIA